MPGAVVIGLFYTYFTPIQAVTVVKGQTDCYDTLLSYEIKYAAARLSCVRSKSQQLWLLHSALDRGKTCSDELFTAWFFQVQQILSKALMNVQQIKFQIKDNQKEIFSEKKPATKSPNDLSYTMLNRV